MIEDAVEHLRAKISGTSAAPTAQESFETRLTLACLRGQGHLLVTGSDRSAIDALLERVIQKVEPMAAVRARATDPAGGLDPVLSLVTSDAIPRAHLERRRALADLLARAEKAEKSVLVVVEDASEASVDQLERLRETLEWIPEALEYLRMVLVGDPSLAAKLDTHEGRALSSRIASRICLDEDPSTPTVEASTPALQHVQEPSRSYALTLAAATCVAFSGSVYLAAFLSGAGEGIGRRSEPVSANVNSEDFAIAVGAPTDAEAARERSSSSVAPFTPAFSIPAPRPAPSGAAPGASTAKPPAGAQAAAATSKPSVTGTKSVTASKPAAKATKSGPKKSSISTFMQRFD